MDQQTARVSSRAGSGCSHPTGATGPRTKRDGTSSSHARSKTAMRTTGGNGVSIARLVTQRQRGPGARRVRRDQLDPGQWLQLSDHRVLAAAARQARPVHPSHQTALLRRARLGNVLRNRFLQLELFPWRAHLSPPITKPPDRSMMAGCAALSIPLTHPSPAIPTPVSRPGGENSWEPGGE